MHAHTCRKKPLARGSVACVEECTCGRLSVHIGPITLYLERDALQPLAQTLDDAVAAMHDERSRAANNLRLLLGHLD